MLELAYLVYKKLSCSSYTPDPTFILPSLSLVPGSAFMAEEKAKEDDEMKAKEGTEEEAEKEAEKDP